MKGELGSDGLYVNAPSRTFNKAVKVCLEKYFDFSGRASRSEYWYFQLFLLIVGLITGFLDLIIFNIKVGETNGPLTGLATLVFILPNAAVVSRRLHDINKSFWWLGGFLIAFIFFILIAISIHKQDNSLSNLFTFFGLVVLVWSVMMIIFLCTKGDLHSNDFDENRTFNTISNNYDKTVNNTLTNDDIDSKHYLTAMTELKENKDDAVWAKCFAENDGDIQKAEANYIKVRALYINNSIKIESENAKWENENTAENLYRKVLYEDKNYKDFKYKHLKNGNVAYRPPFDDYFKRVYIYMSEEDFKLAVDSKNMEMGVIQVFKD